MPISSVAAHVEPHRSRFGEYSPGARTALASRLVLLDLTQAQRDRVPSLLWARSRRVKEHGTGRRLRKDLLRSAEREGSERKEGGGEAHRCGKVGG